MFRLETDELGCANVAVLRLAESYETLGHGRSRGTSFIHLRFVVAEIQGFKIGTFIMEHAVKGFLLILHIGRVIKHELCTVLQNSLYWY